MSRQKDTPVVNADGTITIRGTVAVQVDQRHVKLAVMFLRGYPDGMSLEKYPRQADCEAASPGIVEAHRRCSAIVVLPCDVTVDRDGNRTYTLVGQKP
mgnify:CR=1 FL=1